MMLVCLCRLNLSPDARAMLTITHLLPSSSIFGGFFVRMLSGLGFLPGAGLFPRTAESPEPAAALSEGFLCVISDLSTLRSPLVTESPLFSSLKTAPRPPPAAGAGAVCSLIWSTGGGPGGGGGGGAPPVAGGGGGAAALLVEEDIDLATSAAEGPLGFQGMPLGKYCLTYSERSLKIW